MRAVPQAGTDGYLEFVGLFVRLLQRYAVPLAAALAGLVLLELVLGFNLRSAARFARKDEQVRKASAIYYNNHPVFASTV